MVSPAYIHCTELPSQSRSLRCRVALETMSASDIALQYVVPAVGVAVANVMFASPMLAVLKVRREKSMGVSNA